MPGLLDNYGGGQAGLLGNLGQALANYGPSQSTEPTREEFEEYQRARQQGFTGTFEEFRQRKRSSMTMGGQNGFQTLGRAMASPGRGMGGY